MKYPFNFGSPIHLQFMNHEFLAVDSTRKRYFFIASLANLFLRENCCAIVVKVRLRNTSASSSEIADFSRKNEANPMSTGMTGIGSTRAGESCQGRKNTDEYILMLSV